MESALNITFARAGDPEKLGALFKAAVEAAERPVKLVVPAGYRCVECYRDDGNHEGHCGVGASAAMNPQGDSNE